MNHWSSNLASVVKQEQEEIKKEEESITESRRTESSVKDETNFNPDLTVVVKGREDGEDTEEQNDDQYDNDDNDDSGDEDEEFYRPPEPKYDKANALNFRQLCQRFETLWKQKSKKKKPSKDEILDFLLPRSLQKFIHGDGEQQQQGMEANNENVAQKTTTAVQQQSIFPLLRLICPDKDTTRARLYMKEAVIAKTWAEAIGLSNKSSDYNKLVHYNDPSVAGMSAAGDISMCVFEVVKKRYPEFDVRNGGVTLAKMNELLDELAGVRNANQEQGPTVPNTTKRKAWVKKLLNMKFSVSQLTYIGLICDS